MILFSPKAIFPTAVPLLPSFPIVITVVKGKKFSRLSKSLGNAPPVVLHKLQFSAVSTFKGMTLWRVWRIPWVLT